MVRFEKMTKIYRKSGKELRALDDFTFSVKKGEFIVLKGPSGSGKSTALLAAGGMLGPTSGHVHVKDRDVYGMSTTARAQFRATEIGFVFQMFHLVPYLSVIENVRLAHGGRDRAAAEAVLQELGMQDRVKHRPSELSAGEKQRTAIARALVSKPSLVLADEPTGNLDPENSAVVIHHLKAYRDAGGTVILVSHGDDADAVADRIVRLEAGKLVG